MGCCPTLGRWLGCALCATYRSATCRSSPASVSQNSALTKLHLSGNGVAEHTLRTIGTCCLTAACCCHNTPFGSTDSTPTRAVAAPDSCLESNKNGTPIHAPQEVQEVIKAQVDKFASAAREKQNRMAAVMREREETKETIGGERSTSTSDSRQGQRGV